MHPLKKKLLPLALTAVMAALIGPSASAGLLRDRIMAHRAQAEPDDTLDDGAEAPQAATLPAGVRVIRDVQYGPDGRQRFDVYLPAHAGGAPVLFMVHGGGWRRGDKAMRSVVENKVARWVPQGMILVSTNYRMLPKADPLAQAADVALALATAQKQAASWGGDPKRFVLMGHSAGAHLAALLAASPEIAAKAGAAPWLGTVTLDSAVLNVEQIMQMRHLQLYDQAFGHDPAYWRAASPYHLLAQAGAPLLAVCSSRRVESCGQSTRFAEKAKSLGMRASVLPEDLSHKEINQDLGEPGAYTDAVEKFLRSVGVRLSGAS